MSVNVTLMADNPALTLEPEPISAMMVDVVGDVEGYVYIGDGFDAGHSITDIDVSSILINGSVAPIATEIITLGGAETEVLKVSMPLGDFVEYYVDGLMWDFSYRSYTVTGSYTASGTFGVTDTFEFRGHTSGDLNLDGVVDISDLVFMVDFMSVGGEAPRIVELADVNSSGSLDIADLVYFVDLMFMGGPAPVSP